MHKKLPDAYSQIVAATKMRGFTMPSDILTCSLLQTLATSKPSANFLELGTGTGLSTSWILDGMDINSNIVSIDNDASLIEIAQQYLGSDIRLKLIVTDGADWINKSMDQKFDFIFADTWHGKYILLDEVLQMLNKGGLYVVDDMLPQPNWPDGHHDKADNFVKYLEKRKDLNITKLHWSTGIIIAVKR